MSETTNKRTSKQVKSIAVLTSGGDAPGMNAALRAVVRSALKHGLEVFFVNDGYKGLVEGDIHPVIDRNFVKDIINRGGTIIQSGRLPEFAKIEVQKKAVLQLKRRNIDSLIAIGGDGTYRGLLALSKLGVHCVGIPGTIDNDIASTDYTIGFDTCLNTICDCVDKIRDTSSSHQRCSLIEVMGRHCGDLAVFSGIAEGVEAVITYDYRIPEEEFINDLRELERKKKHHAIILISENLLDINELAAKINRETGFECKTEVLGRLQRGGKPSAFDRILASKLGNHAVETLIQGRYCRVTGIIANEVKDIDINEALSMSRDRKENLTRLLDILR